MSISDKGLAQRNRRSLALLLIAAFVCGPFQSLPLVDASAPQALDGIGVKGCSLYSIGIGACSSQLLTTTRGHDVIILLCQCFSKITIMDTSGLIFTLRLSFSPYSNSFGLVEYYAIAPSRLVSDNITVIGHPPAFSFLRGLQVVAIHGVNSKAIFDSNPSIPATVFCPGTVCGVCSTGGGACSASIQTSHLDLVIAGTMIGDAPPCGGDTPGVPGFTTITTSIGYGGFFEFDYKVTTEPQSRVVFNCSGTDVGGIVIDAVSLHP